MMVKAFMFVLDFRPVLGLRTDCASNRCLVMHHWLRAMLPTEDVRDRCKAMQFSSKACGLSDSDRPALRSFVASSVKPW